MMMQTFIEQVRIEPQKFIRNNTWWERLVSWPVKVKTVPILCRDKYMSFTKLMLQGLDFDFIMLDVLTITFMDVVGRNDTNLGSPAILGLLVAYILDHSLIWLREYFGRRNIAKSTLTDERFLI